jgi:hypothetical protein
MTSKSKTIVYRAFTPEFISYVQCRSGKLSASSAKVIVSTKYRSGEYEKLAKGDCVNEMYLRRYLESLASPDPSIDRKTLRLVEHSRHIVEDYLKDRGIPSLQNCSIDTVMGHLCTPPSTSADDPDFDPMLGPMNMIRGASTLINPRRFALGCTLPSEFLELTTGMYESLGKQILPGGPHATPAERLEAGAKRIRLPADDYAASAQTWSDWNRWTVLRTRLGSQVVGATIALPLNERAYEEVRSGRMPSWGVRPSDLQIPSTNIVLEACSSRVFDTERPPRGQNFALYACLSMQIAVFSRPLAVGPQRRQIRLLAGGGSPRNEQRLRASEYIPLGVAMAKTGVPLYERVLRQDEPLANVIYLGVIALLDTTEPPPFE